jgi:ABC-type transport system involved in multi-copper enzyme maturation permease subunit
VRLVEVAHFEIGYRLRRASTWFFAVLLLVLPVVVMQALSNEPQHVNSPISTATAVAFIGIVGMLITAAIFGDAATRDADTGMRPLFFTAPLTKLEYLGGRFLGAFVVNAGLLIFIPIGLLLGTWMPYGEPVTFGPFIPGAYIEPLLTIALPNLIFTAAILFTVAALTRSTLPAYLAAVGLFVGYLIATQWQERVASRELAMLLDPFGAIVIERLASYLSPTEKDTVRLGMPAILLFNRLVWLAIGGAVLAFLARRFRFELSGDSGRRRRDEPREPQKAAEGRRKLQLPNPFPKAPADEVLWGHLRPSAVTAVRQTLSIAGIELAEIIASRIFRIVLAAAVIMVFAFGWDVGSIVFDTSTWPLTHLVASVMRGPAAMAVVVLIAVYAGELVWKERNVRVAEIADTAPVSTWIPLAGKFLALLGMIVVVQATFLVSGVLLQVVRGYYVFELGLYFRILFGFLLATYVLFAVFAMAAHVVLDRKHLGHAFVALFFAYLLFATEFGLTHNLLKYGGDPGWVYSDMNGFGPFVAPFVWFKLYWAAWALLLGVVAVLLYVRGTERGWRQRVTEARMRLTGGVVRAAAVAGVLIVTLGAFIFYNTNVLNEYRTEDEIAAAAAEYEKRFREYENAPQPVIVSAAVGVEIHPERGAVDLRGTYWMVNRSNRAIDSVHVVALRNVTVRSLEFTRGLVVRPAHLVLQDNRHHQYRIYGLAYPLAPGDTLRLTFDHAFERRGFPNRGINTSVAENGAYFDRSWLPRIGYQTSFELGDEYERQKHGLPPRPAAGLDDERGKYQRFESRDADVVSVDVVIGTADDQIAVTPGTLVNEWRDKGRRYFHYKTDAPISFGVPVLSARYAVREDRWNGVALKIYHHPTHTFNLDRMMLAMKASLDYFTNAFGPYQFKELRIVEFPRYANFARAHPHTIAYSEGGAFLTRVDEGDVDRPFFVTAHEIAHQWWGGQISGARVAGVGMLSETLAQYGAMMVMEKTYGREQVKKFYNFEMDRYLRGRGVFRGSEVPLIRVMDQSYVYYQKGAVAMYTLKEHIGEDRVNAALRAFLDKYRDAGPPYATSRDLYKELQAVTPDSMKYLLVDLFETITLWDVRVKAARAEQIAPDSYRVTMDVVGKKVRADSMGVETEVPMNDLAEIAVFAGNERSYIERHRIRSGEQRITLTVSRKPESVGVDPYHNLIQRVKDGKVVALEELGTSPWTAEYRARRYDSARVKIPLPNF